MLNTNNFPIDLPHLILASGSPRRAEILTSVGWTFTKIVPGVDESERSGESASDYVRRLALEKAAAIAGERPDAIVLGADTTVVLEGRIIGKPLDPDDARRMIRMLSGNWHEVLTGVAVVSGMATETGVQSTRVKFAEMNDHEVDYLVEHGDPLDKAGAYAVQAQAALFIEAIEGDYWNVVGLPVNLVYSLVRKVEAQK
jgi:septum formation protein